MLNAQLKKGVLEICVLKILHDGDEYGYPIIQKMESVFDGVGTATLYAILRRLEKSKYASTYYGDVSRGPRRKYYHITERGDEYYKNGVEEWRNICLAMGKVGINFA